MLLSTSDAAETGPGSRLPKLLFFTTTMMLPVEIIHLITSYLSPEWSGQLHNSPTVRRLAWGDLSWFMGLRLVSRLFDEMILDHFIAAIREDRMGEDLPLQWGPMTNSMLAMNRRVVKVYMQRPCLRERSAWAQKISRAADVAVELFSPPGESDQVEIRDRYTDAMIVVVASILGSPPLITLEASATRVQPDPAPLRGLVFMAAAYLGRYDHMIKCRDMTVAFGPDPNAAITMPLMAAALGGRIDIVKTLTENTTDRLTNSWPNPVPLAALGGHAEVIRILAEKGFHVDYGLYTPLHLAARNGNTEAVKALMETGNIRPNAIRGVSISYGLRQPLVIAIAENRIEVVEELLKWDAVDVNITEQPQVLGFHPMGLERPLTALALAAAYGREEIFQMLWARPDALRSKEEVELMRSALRGGSVRIVETILESDPTALSKYHETEMEGTIGRAAEFGNEKLIRWILSTQKVPINGTNGLELSSLHCTVESCHPGTVKAVLEHPDIEVNDFNNWIGATPLQYAVAMKHADADIVDALLNDPRTDPCTCNPFFLPISVDGFSRAGIMLPDWTYDAEVELDGRDVDNEALDVSVTPLANGARLGRAEVLKVLLSHDRVEKHPVSAVGDTPLLSAAHAGQKNTLETLLCHPATKLWHRNNDGNGAISLASSAGQVDIVQRLLETELGKCKDTVEDAMEQAEIAVCRVRGQIMDREIIERSECSEDTWNRLASEEVGTLKIQRLLSEHLGALVPH